jgi:colanic acid/amylovoran biosynthesis glycosyltransferase
MKVGHLFNEFCPGKSPFRYWLTVNPYVDSSVYCLRRTHEKLYPHNDVFAERFTEHLRRIDSKPLRYLTSPLASCFHRFYWRRFLGRSDIDLLHVQFGDKAARFLPMINRSNLPLLVTFHGSDVNRALVSDSRREDLQRVFKRASICHFVSNDLRRKAIQLGCPPEISRTIYIGAPKHAVHASKRKHAHKSDTQFFCVANLIPCKGHETLLRAFAQTLPHLPKCKLHLLGDGPLRGTLESLANDLVLGDSIQFHGHIPNEQTIELLRANADVVILASQRDEHGSEEGLPISLQEAAGLGIPSIGTICGGIPEVISDGKTGYVVPQCDSTALSNAMVKLGTSTGLRSEFGETAFELARKLFDLDRFYKNIAEVYTSVLAR